MGRGGAKSFVGFSAAGRHRTRQKNPGNHATGKPQETAFGRAGLLVGVKHRDLGKMAEAAPSRRDTTGKTAAFGYAASLTVLS